MSTLVVTNISDGSVSVPATYVTSGVAKAQVNYDQIAVTVDSSVNVTSVSDDATGFWTMSFTNNMNDAVFRLAGTGGRQAADGGHIDLCAASVDAGGQTTASSQVQLGQGTVETDRPFGSALIFGDLA